MPVVNTLTVTSIVLFCGFALAGAADKDLHFAPGPAASYPTRQTIEKVTIAAIPYISEEQVRSAFGKLDPNKYGILPLLLVIHNEGGQTIKLDSLKLEYITSGRTHIEPTAARARLHGVFRRDLDALTLQ